VVEFGYYNLVKKIMKIDSVLIYESQYVISLYPFSILHCGWELRIGAFKYFEKVQKQFPDARIIYNGREGHLKSFLARFETKSQDIKKENIFILNSTIIPTKDFWASVEIAYNEYIKQDSITKSVIFEHKSVPVAAYMTAEDILNPIDYDKNFLPKLISDFNRLMPHIEIPEPKLANFLWDTLDIVGNEIKNDSTFFNNKVEFNELRKNNISFINQNSILIGEETKIGPGVVLDADEGPVIIGKNVKIYPNAVILGPCYIGDNSTVKIGAKIYENTSIGENCKVGGEIENSIIHAYSNKQHEGFLGHSYISEWVNLGADTNTSDLKNTYSNIKVNFHKQEIYTGRMFLGLLCGDHTKSAINTSFTTGTVAGICGILVNDGFLPNYIPSFAWRGNKGCTHYKLDKALETAKIVMGRRNKSLTPEEEELIISEYNSATQDIYK